MNSLSSAPAPRSRGCRPLALLALATALLAAMPAGAQDAASLKGRHEALRATLARNAFQRPLVLESRERENGLQGDIYARIEMPMTAVAPALTGIDHWCEILMLHLNVKQCRAGDSKAGDALQLVIGQKHDQALDQAYRVEFAYRVLASTPDYLQVQLTADEGPLGTHDYRIVLEVAALDARRSFLHLSYAYGVGMMARVAMQGYLATIGRDKVGFSIVGRKADGSRCTSPAHAASSNATRCATTWRSRPTSARCRCRRRSASRSAWPTGTAASNATRCSCTNSNAASTSA